MAVSRATYGDARKRVGNVIFLLPQAIDETAQRAPDRLAMRYLDETLTYAELAIRSNQLANTLSTQGVRRRDRVGIYMDKALEVPVALYGIMKAGT